MSIKSRASMRMITIVQRAHLKSNHSIMGNKKILIFLAATMVITASGQNPVLRLANCPECVNWLRATLSDPDVAADLRKYPTKACDYICQNPNGNQLPNQPCVRLYVLVPENVCEALCFTQGSSTQQHCVANPYAVNLFQQLGLV